MSGPLGLSSINLYEHPSLLHQKLQTLAYCSLMKLNQFPWSFLLNKWCVASSHIDLNNNKNWSAKSHVAVLQSLSHVQLFVTQCTVAHQAALSMEFPRQECWSWVAIFFSKGSANPRDRTRVSCFGRRILYHWATRKACQVSYRLNITNLNTLTIW